MKRSIFSLVLLFPTCLLAGTLQVDGDAMRSVMPDTIVCSFEIAAEDPDVAKAAADFAARHDDAVKHLAERGFTSNEVAMATLDMAPRYEYESGSWSSKCGGSEKVFKGYRYSAHHTVTFPFDRARLTALYAALIACDTVPRFQVAFQRRDRAAIERELRGEAVRDAIARAEDYAQAFGVKLVELKSAKEEDAVTWREGANLAYEAAPPRARQKEPVPDFSDMTPQEVTVLVHLGVTFTTK